MAPLYSVRLFSQGGLSIGTTTCFVVPEGFRVVVRDVIAINRQTPPALLGGLFVYETSTDVNIFSVASSAAYPGVMFTYDGRATLDPGMEVAVNVADAQWSLFLSGFQLSLP